MRENTYRRINNGLSYMVWGVVIIFTVIRLFFGAELSDEAYAVAEPYMVSRGALPFVNNWSQMPGYTLLLAPFMKLYTILAGTEGIFLFFRFLTLAINFAVAVAVFFIIRKYVDNISVLLLCVLMYVGASGSDYTAAFRGDSLALDLLAVGVLLLAKAFSEEGTQMFPLLWSGFLTALAVMCYPTLVIEYAYFVIAIIFLCIKKKKNFKRILWFLAGSAIATIIIVGYLAVNSSFGDIIEGIEYLLKDVMYFQIKNEGMAKVPTYIKIICKEIMRLFGLFAVCLLFVAVGMQFLCNKKLLLIDKEYCSIRKNDLKRMILTALVAGICLDYLYQIWRFKTADNIYISLYALTIETFAVPIFWLFVKRYRKISNYLMGLIWLPSYVLVAVTGGATYSPILGRHNLLKNAAFLVGLFCVWAIKDTFEEDEEGICDEKTVKNRLWTFLKYSLPVILISGTAFTHLFNSYTYMYREEPIIQLNTTITSGPYKGIFTTKARADGLQKIDEIISNYVEEEDYVLAMDNDPFIYLMSEGKICAPCTWDMALYSYDFDEPDLYYDYFKVTETEPTKIIYFNYGRDEILSIDTKYRFNDYVLSNYNLIYENRNVFEWKFCGQDIVCELLIFDKK